MTRQKIVYDQWSGNPKGFPENDENCIEEVWAGYHSHQCPRKRGHGKGGLFCKQHSKRYPEVKDAGNEKS